MEQPENPTSKNLILSITRDSIASRAFNTFPIENLFIETNDKLALISCPKTPTYNCVMEIRNKNLFENKAKAIKPLNLRIQNLLNEIKINPKIIHHTILLKTSPWTINQPIVKLELTKLFKTKRCPITFQEKFLNIQNNFPDHHHTYTDGSKLGMKVACAAFLQELLKHLPNESSVNSAGVTAIDLAMNIIANHKSSKFIIYLNSKSVFLVLQNKDTSYPLIIKLINKMNTLSPNNNIILTWILNYIGIYGNERADKAEGEIKLSWQTNPL